MRADARHDVHVGTVLEKVVVNVGQFTGIRMKPRNVGRNQQHALWLGGLRGAQLFWRRERLLDLAIRNNGSIRSGMN